MLILFHFISILKILQADPFEISLLQQSERFSPVYKINLPLLRISGPSSPRNFPGKLLLSFVPSEQLFMLYCWVQFHSQRFEVRPSCSLSAANDVQLFKKGRRKD